MKRSILSIGLALVASLALAPAAFAQHHGGHHGHGNGGVSVGVHIGGYGGGVGVHIGSGGYRGGYDHRGYDHRYDNRGYDRRGYDYRYDRGNYRNYPTYRPYPYGWRGPVYNGHWGYRGPAIVIAPRYVTPSIQVDVVEYEPIYDRDGYVIGERRVDRWVTAYWDAGRGGYWYRDCYGDYVRVR